MDHYFPVEHEENLNWKNLVIKETEYYKFSVPASWHQYEMRAGTNPEQFFEASGVKISFTMDAEQFQRAV